MKWGTILVVMADVTGLDRWISVAVSYPRQADLESSLFSSFEVGICGGYKSPGKWAKHSWLANVTMCGHHVGHVHNDNIWLVLH